MSDSPSDPLRAAHEATKMRWVCDLPFPDYNVELWQCPKCKDVVQVSGNVDLPMCEGKDAD